MSERFEDRGDVVVSNQFFGWIVEIEGKVVIKGTERVKTRFAELLNINYSD